VATPPRPHDSIHDTIAACSFKKLKNVIVDIYKKNEISAQVTGEIFDAIMSFDLNEKEISKVPVMIQKAKKLADTPYECTSDFDIDIAPTEIYDTSDIANLDDFDIAPTEIYDTSDIANLDDFDIAPTEIMDTSDINDIPLTEVMDISDIANLDDFDSDDDSDNDSEINFENDSNENLRGYQLKEIYDKSKPGQGFIMYQWDNQPEIVKNVSTLFQTLKKIDSINVKFGMMNLCAHRYFKNDSKDRLAQIIFPKISLNGVWENCIIVYEILNPPIVRIPEQIKGRLPLKEAMKIHAQQKIEKEMKISKMVQAIESSREAALERFIKSLNI
jgi:hypothetical protein